MAPGRLPGRHTETIEGEMPDETAQMQGPPIVAVWVSNAPGILAKAQRMAGKKHPGLTLHSYNPKFFRGKDDLVTRDVRTAYVEAGFDAVIKAYEAANIPIVLVGGVREAVPAAAVAPEPPGQPPEDYIDPGLVQQVGDLSVSKIGALIETQESRAFVKALRDHEKGKEHPRSTALKLYDEWLNSQS